MTYDEISTVLQIIGGIVLTISFAVGIAIIWAGIKASKEKDTKVLAQEERIAELNTETAELRVEAEKAKTERADADKEIAFAKAEAAKANEETARLTLEAESAKKEIAIAKADAANADLRSAEASVKVADLQIVVANAEQKRVEAETALLALQEKIRDRRLSTEQRAVLLERLQQAPKGKIEVLCPVGAPEADFFAREITEVLTESGWQVEYSNRSLFVGSSPVGLKLKLYLGTEHTGKREVTVKVSAKVVALISAFEAANLMVVREGDDKMKPEDIKLIVGFKP